MRAGTASWSAAIRTYAMTPSEFTCLLYELRGHVAVVSLNRPMPKSKPPFAPRRATTKFVALSSPASTPPSAPAKT